MSWTKNIDLKDYPITRKQRDFLEDNGISFTDETTGKGAERLIDDYIAVNKRPPKKFISVEAGDVVAYPEKSLTGWVTKSRGPLCSIKTFSGAIVTAGVRYVEVVKHARKSVDDWCPASFEKISEARYRRLTE